MALTEYCAYKHEDLSLSLESCIKTWKRWWALPRNHTEEAELTAQPGGRSCSLGCTCAAHPPTLSLIKRVAVDLESLQS